MLLSRVGNTELRPITPVTEKSIASSPGVELAVVMAPRKLQSPGAAVQAVNEASSERVSTVNVAALTAEGEMQNRQIATLKSVKYFAVDLKFLGLLTRMVFSSVWA